jgi:AraC family transcriptional regulator, transcriptional activator of pobA
MRVMSVPVSTPRSRPSSKSPAKDQSDIQRYFLYGFDERPFDERFMHCERIEEQLESHGWDAKPHVHEGLHQIQYFEQGHGQLVIEDQWRPFEAPLLLLVPSGTVHGFHFSRDTTGHVLTISEDFMQEVLGFVEPVIKPVIERPSVQMLRAAQVVEHGLDPLFAMIASDYHQGARGRSTVLMAGLAALLVKVARLSAPPEEHTATATTPYLDFFRKFRELVEQSFRQQLSVAHYADTLGLTVGRLTAICRSVADASPQEIQHRRLLIEAKRLLLYTARSSHSIAYTLGFKDPAYFSRFFKRETGKSPKEFRAQRQLGE